MKLGVVSTALPAQDLPSALKHCEELALDAIELGAGGYFPKTLCDPAHLLADRSELDKFRSALEESTVSVCALAIHGQPLHPDESIAKAYSDEFTAACQLANELEIGKLTLLAGLPAGAPGDTTPNWTFYPFPQEGQRMLAWQWDECLLPYWRKAGEIASRSGVRLCFEMHPNDLVYQPSGLLRLRHQIGPVVGANLDPSHLFWQGIDAVRAVELLGDAIYHVHAKDAAPNLTLLAGDGWLDARPQTNPSVRSWNFRTVGYGHDELFWRRFLSALRQVGYDDVVSIEHEDPLLTGPEGLDKAVRLLLAVLPRDAPGQLWFDSERGSS